MIVGFDDSEILTSHSFINSIFITGALSSSVTIPSLFRIYLEKRFSLYNFQWKDIYTLSQKVSVKAYLRSFQYKILDK